MAKLNDKMFNRVVEGRLYSDKGVPLDELFDNVVYNESTNTTEVGGNLYVDGEIISGAPTDISVFGQTGIIPYTPEQVMEIFHKYRHNGFCDNKYDCILQPINYCVNLNDLAEGEIFLSFEARLRMSVMSDSLDYIPDSIDSAVAYAFFINGNGETVFAGYEV